MTEREKFEWEREHSSYSVEGQIEAYGALARGLTKYRAAFGRLFLAGALVFGALALIAAIRSLT
jgi:hypothetical protein